MTDKIVQLSDRTKEKVVSQNLPHERTRSAALGISKEQIHSWEAEALARMCLPIMNDEQLKEFIACTRLHVMILRARALENTVLHAKKMAEFYAHAWKENTPYDRALDDKIETFLKEVNQLFNNEQHASDTTKDSPL